ncbi:AAA family ATPase [Candidatus Woesearchaeota archaeon]|nr:AAA family ATPase [Candidatus Woesearchaeota archaeon]
MTNAKTIGIIAIKGGVGKTTTVANLGAALAVQGKKVLLIDGNISSNGLGLHFGCMRPTASVQDVLLGKRSMTSAIMTIDDYIDILPSVPVHQHVDMLRLRQCLAEVKHAYDVLLIDAPPTLNKELLGVMLASDDLFVVSTPDYPTLYATMHASKIAKRRNMPIEGIILTHVRDKPFELTIEDIEKHTDIPILAVMPYDQSVHEAIAHTKPVVSYCPQSHVAAAYLELAACLIGEKFRDPRWLHRVKRFFFNETKKDYLNRKQYKKRSSIRKE